MEASKTVIMEMYHDAKVDNNKCMISPKIVSRVRDFATFLAVIINIIMLIFYQTDEDQYYKGIEVNETALLIIQILCGFQIFCSILVIISYVLSNGPLILRHKWDSHVSEQKRKMENHDEILEVIFATMGSTFSELSPEQERLLLHLEGPYSDRVKDIKGIRGIDYYMICLTFICTDGSFIYYLFYCTISVLGLVIHPIYITFLLLDFSVRFELLSNITKNKVALGMTSMLIVIILYIYASVGFFFFHDMMYTYDVNTYDSDQVGESLCQNMIQCFVTLMNLGLRNGGGIGDAIKPETYSNTERYYPRAFYTVSFHVIVILVMLNIVFGIIIDTFAQLRNEKKEIQHDQNNKCYICNLDRYMFDQDGDGFENHCENDHNMWNYIFYIVHLQTKDPTEFTGIESYVWKRFLKDEMDWLPLHKAIVIDNKENENEVLTTEEEAVQKLEFLYQKLKILSRKVAKIKK